MILFVTIAHRQVSISLTLFDTRVESSTDGFVETVQLYWKRTDVPIKYPCQQQRSYSIKYSFESDFHIFWLIFRHSLKIQSKDYPFLMSSHSMSRGTQLIVTIQTSTGWAGHHLNEDQSSVAKLHRERSYSLWIQVQTTTSRELPRSRLQYIQCF